MQSRSWLALAGFGLLTACAGSPEPVPDTDTRSRAMEGSALPEDDQGRCDTDAADREVSEYDTSGDDHPDVRRVFRRIGNPPTVRLILACREADLNGDGIKDVVRYYNEEGRPLREEADRNFDGTMDVITYFQEGRIIREEQDSNGDGTVDTKIYYERGVMSRTERDLAGRSTATHWQPDRWEYFDNGRMVRMGTDVDGDGNVDRWDRDMEWSEQQRASNNDEAVDQAVAETPGMEDD